MRTRNQMSVTQQSPLIPLTASKMVGYQIRQQREARRLSQRQLADKAQTTQASIAHIESGQANPTLQLLERIAEALNRDLKIKLSP